MADEMVAAAMTAIRLAAAESRGEDDQFAGKIVELTVELAEQRGVKALQYLVAALARAGAGGFIALANHADQPFEKVLDSYELHVQSGLAAQREWPNW